MGKISGRELAKQLGMRFFTSSLIRTIINTIIPIVISIYSCYYNDNVTFIWYLPIIVMIFMILAYNITAGKLLVKEKKELTYMDLLEECYRNQANINRRSATKMFRLHKIINTHLSNNKPIDKVVFDKVADFNTISFDICNSIYKMIESKYGVDTKCEVTVFQSLKDGIVMIAYANKNEEPPTSYMRTYKKSKKYLFGKLFQDLNANIHICHNKETVKKDFHFIEDSKTREEQICQYIGIPLFTARKKIELLLQIDVSKPNVFGKTYEDVLKVAENIFYPYIALLNKAYERDLIFNEYYDLIVKSLSESEEKNEN